MNIKKRTAYLLSAVFAAVLAAFSCTACMSAEERRQAEADIKAARPVVENYLADNFGGGQVICIDFMQAKKYPGPIPDFGVYSSGYCKADVRLENNDEFQVVVNVEDGACYDNYRTDDVIGNAVEKIISLTDGTKPENIEVNVSARDLLGALGSGYEGFLSRDTDTAEKLLNGDYYVNIVLKYGSSINGVDVSRLENTSYKASITLRLLQFSEFVEGGTKLDVLGKSDSNLTLDDSLSYLYLREYLLLDNFRMSDEENFTRFQKSDTVTYLQKQVDDLIFAWNSSAVDMSISAVRAERQISTEYYSGKKFTALSDTAAKLDYISKTESRYCDVYAFTKDNFNDTPYIAGNGNGGTKDVADSMMIISGTDYHSASFKIKGVGSITVGLYKR